ncbi:MAG TPA: ABC transporter permease, partial [Acidimicrobiia bacterium]|nr:ABC transporter permease [Acidimicrobiia bacterium]
MNLQRSSYVFGRELKLSPRSPLVFFAIAMPFLITFLISSVFGSLFDVNPRLGIVDEGDSAVTAAAMQLDGVDTTVVVDADTLRARVEAHDFDAGLVLPAGFDEAIRAGQNPDLQFYISGESLASTRVILAVTTIDLVRGVAGDKPAVNTVVTLVGDENYVPISDRLLPTMVIYAVMIAALFLPAASLVDEREKRTLDAVLVTPTTITEVLVGKGAFSVILATIMGVVTLALNNAFAGQAATMALILSIGSVMLMLMGLALGLWAKDITTLYTAIKAGGIVIFLPVLFTLFPGLPQWIPKLVPTYYFLQPIYDLAIGGDTFSDVLPEILIAVAICIALVPLVAWVARRSEQQLAMTV